MHSTIFIKTQPTAQWLGLIPNHPGISPPLTPPAYFSQSGILQFCYSKEQSRILQRDPAMVWSNHQCGLCCWYDQIIDVGYAMVWSNQQCGLCCRYDRIINVGYAVGMMKSSMWVMLLVWSNHQCGLCCWYDEIIKVGYAVTSLLVITNIDYSIMGQYVQHYLITLHSLTFLIINNAICCNNHATNIGTYIKLNNLYLNNLQEI